jgi:hypothetical protein
MTNRGFLQISQIKETEMTNREVILCTFLILVLLVSSTFFCRNGEVSTTNVQQNLTKYAIKSVASVRCIPRTLVMANNIEYLSTNTLAKNPYKKYVIRA